MREALPVIASASRYKGAMPMRETIQISDPKRPALLYVVVNIHVLRMISLYWIASRISAKPFQPLALAMTGCGQRSAVNLSSQLFSNALVL